MRTVDDDDASDPSFQPPMDDEDVSIRDVPYDIPAALPPEHDPPVQVREGALEAEGASTSTSSPFF